MQQEVLELFLLGCWSMVNFEGASAPAPELFAILSLLRLPAPELIKKSYSALDPVP